MKRAGYLLLIFLALYVASCNDMNEDVSYRQSSQKDVTGAVEDDLTFIKRFIFLFETNYFYESRCFVFRREGFNACPV